MTPEKNRSVYSQRAEHLTLPSLGKSPSQPKDSSGRDKSGDRPNLTFTEDESLPAMFRAKLQFRSGYDRGHIVRTLSLFWSSDFDECKVATFRVAVRLVRSE